jgi:hypothetical protein
MWLSPFPSSPPGSAFFLLCFALQLADVAGQDDDEDADLSSELITIEEDKAAAAKLLATALATAPSSASGTANAPEDTDPTAPPAPPVLSSDPQSSAAAAERGTPGVTLLLVLETKLATPAIVSLSSTLFSRCC